MRRAGVFRGAWLVGAMAAALSGCASIPAQTGSISPSALSAEAAGLAQLHPIEIPAATSAGDTFVVLYSGDSGWSAAPSGFSAALAEAGVPIVGIDSLRYFVRRRSPKAAAADLAAVIEHYAASWNRPKVILVGYSFGADSLPLIVEQLAAEERARVRSMVLISPADRADMVFDGLSLINLTLPGARPLAPALLTLGAIPAICIRAKYDPRAACDRFPPRVIASVHLPGWHRYRGQYRAVARIILSSGGLAAPQAVGPAAAQPPALGR